MLRTLRNLVVGTAIISSAAQASSISTSPRDWVPLPDVVSATMEGDRSQAPIYLLDAQAFFLLWLNLFRPERTAVRFPIAFKPKLRTWPYRTCPFGKILAVTQ